MLSLYGKALETIKSPFVAQLLETWQDTSHVFVATKLMLGGDLEGRLKTSPNKGEPVLHPKEPVIQCYWYYILYLKVVLRSTVDLFIV